ncbi:MAG: hypothetical protein ACP6IY_20685 [Promethearchaeia archaeon]
MKKDEYSIEFSHKDEFNKKYTYKDAKFTSVNIETDKNDIKLFISQEKINAIKNIKELELLVENKIKQLDREL